MNITEYSKKIGLTIPAAKIGKYHYTLVLDLMPIVKNQELYYTLRATNIEREVVEKDLVYIPNNITFKDKNKLLLESELNEFKNKLRKKILETQSYGADFEQTADLTTSSATLILIENRNL